MKKTTTTKKTTAKAAVKPAKKISIAQAPAPSVALLGDSLTIRISAEVKAELRLRALTEGHGKMSRVAQALLAQALGL
jgi:hypothetical protein